MATFSGEEQLDLLIKKLFYGVAKGGSSDNYTFANEVHDSFLAVKPSNIWTNASSIPTAPPSTTDTNVEVYIPNAGANQNAPLELTAVDLAGNAGTYNNFRKQWVALDDSDDRLKNWIGPGYGGAYAARVYVGATGWDGTDSDATTKGIQEISFGGNAAADWFFDYEAGVLFWTNENLGETGDFQESANFTTDTSLIANGDVVYIKAYRYIGGTGLGSASNVTVSDSDDNTAFPLVFTDGASSSASLKIDSANPPTYNPYYNVLSTAALTASVSFSTGSLAVNGNTVLGDTATDEIDVNALFVSDLVPKTTNVRDLGSSALKWAEVHATTFHGALTGNADTVTTNADLTGPITSNGNATTITDDAVTYAKMQNVATANRLLGSISADGIISEVQATTDMIADDAITAAKLADAINSSISANASAAAAAQATADAALPSSGAAAALGIDHLITLSGMAASSDNLGTFTGDTIGDNLTVKAALQALETEIATVQSDVNQNEVDADAAIDNLIDGTTDFTLIDVNGGTLDGVTIATSDITVGSGNTLNVSSGTLTLADDQISGDKVEGGTITATTITTLTSGTIQATTLKANDGTAAGSIANSTGVVTLLSSVLTTADINGGTIDATAIGLTGASTGAFTTLSATGNLTVGGDLTIQGDFIQETSTNVIFEDTFLDLNVPDTVTADITSDSGLRFGTAASSASALSAHAQFMYDATNDKFKFTREADAGNFSPAQAKSGADNVAALKFNMDTADVVQQTSQADDLTTMPDDDFANVASARSLGAVAKCSITITNQTGDTGSNYAPDIQGTNGYVIKHNLNTTSVYVVAIKDPSGTATPVFCKYSPIDANIVRVTVGVTTDNEVYDIIVIG